MENEVLHMVSELVFSLAGSAIALWLGGLLIMGLACWVSINRK